MRVLRTRKENEISTNLQHDSRKFHPNSMNLKLHIYCRCTHSANPKSERPRKELNQKTRFSRLRIYIEHAALLLWLIRLDLRYFAAELLFYY